MLSLIILQRVLHVEKRGSEIGERQILLLR